MGLLVFGTYTLEANTYDSQTSSQTLPSESSSELENAHTPLLLRDFT